MSAVVGPFESVPFESRVGVSSLSTREKKDSDDQRVIMDLSWPPSRLVNDGIAKDQFMWMWAKLMFPTIDTMAYHVAELGVGARMFKVDLTRYFRQLPMDQFNYSLLCFTWNEKIYFDVITHMGLCSAPYVAQRTSNGIRYIHNSLGYFLFNYIDEFLGAEQKEKVWQSFHTFQHTIRDLGIQESESKCVEPTEEIN